MKNIKNSTLFVASLVMAFTFFSSAAFAKAENINQADVNDSQASVNANQANINANQAKINATQAKVNEDQADVNEKQGKSNELSGEEHRSGVATFVQSLLNVADRERGGIGDQVREIANAQNDSKEAIADAIDAVKNRSGLKTFFIGTDYKNIGQLRSEMVKTENQIKQLTELLGQMTVAEDKTSLQAQIQSLEQGQQKINDFVKVNEDKFSLFGWFVKLFNK